MNAEYVQVGKTLNFRNDSAADIKYGDVVVAGDIAGVAECDIPKGAIGTLGVSGVYEMNCPTAAVSFGKKLYFDIVAKNVSETAANNTYIGVAAETKAVGISRIMVLLK